MKISLKEYRTLGCTVSDWIWYAVCGNGTHVAMSRVSFESEGKARAAAKRFINNIRRGTTIQFERAK